MTAAGTGLVLSGAAGLNMGWRSFEYAGSLIAGSLCVALAAAALWRDRRRALVDWVFAAGLVVLAAEAYLTAAASRAYDPGRFLRWQHIRLWVTALVPGVWLLFSLSFARANPREAIRRHRLVVGAACLVPLGLLLAFPHSLYRGVARSAPTVFTLPLGRAGLLFEISFLAGCVLVLLNLERTLRASTGSMRWFIKFMALGVGCLFAARVYTTSQALLYLAYDEAVEPVKTAALLVAAGLMALSLERSRLRDAEVYLSAAALHSSFVVAAVGVYLLVVGILASVARRYGGAEALPVITSFVFLALLGLTILLLSGEVRRRTRRLVSRHFRRPHYEYRTIWRSFTERTSSLVEEHDLARAVARFVSETLRVPSVTVWLADEASGAVTLGGSTVYSEERAGPLAVRYAELFRSLGSEEAVVDLWALGRGQPEPGCGEARVDVKHGVLLRAGSETPGLMVLGERGNLEPLNDEDLDLLSVMADQAAASLLNLRLGGRLLKAKEMEAFQSLSAFFVHDLKNLASKLSLTMRNLPAHYDDPGFRQDLLGFMERSVGKINEMCTRLSPLSRGLEIQPRTVDLNDVVDEALSGLEGALAATLDKRFDALPVVLVDPEQIQKVVVNLVLNANDATGPSGHIQVSTIRFGDAVGLAVSDNGRGMSREFVRRSLFQPFQTTKAQGLGIGLYHSRKIAEAHGGRIEVESEEGRGSTFRVLLPIRVPRGGKR
jgi:putative PEP-CTERM system histidine kinase